MRSGHLAKNTDDSPRFDELIESPGDPNPHGLSFATFAASRISFCPRQAYLTHLGLRSDTQWRGRFQTRRLIQNHLKNSITEHPQFTIEPQMSFSTETVRIIGRPTCYDTSKDIVYHLKPRNGWYKFNPPIQRHLIQLKLYLHGMKATRGQLVYVSMADVTDTRTWPADFTDDEHVTTDKASVAGILETAEAIRAEIIQNGVASSPDDIPFDPCGCYLCQTEELNLPQTTRGLEGVVERAQERTDQDSPDQAKPPSPTTEVTPPSIDPGDTGEKLAVDRRHIPQGLRGYEYWVLWDGESKRALAPWQTGTMYPAKWAAGEEVDPRRDFTKSKIVAEMSIEDIHEAWPFPEDLPDRVIPTILLPHEPEADPPLVFVDVDDVRDPETGETTAEGVALLRRLDGYAALSNSGRGFHIWVRGNLPADSVAGPLDQSGRIEIYDRSRFTASTWCHLEGTPTDEIPIADEALSAITNRVDVTR